MAESTLEQRVASLEQSFADLERKLTTDSRSRRNWLSAVLGRFKGDADFAEVALAGQELRATGRLPDEPCEDEGQQ